MIKKYGDKYVNLGFVTHWQYKEWSDGVTGVMIFTLHNTIFIEGVDISEQIKKDMEEFTNGNRPKHEDDGRQDGGSPRRRTDTETPDGSSGTGRPG